MGPTGGARALATYDPVSGGTRDREAPRSLTDVSRKPVFSLSLRDGGSNAAKVRAEAVRRKWRGRRTSSWTQHSTPSTTSLPRSPHGSSSGCRILLRPWLCKQTHPRSTIISLIIAPHLDDLGILPAAAGLKSRAARRPRPQQQAPTRAARRRAPRWGCVELRKCHCAFVYVIHFKLRECHRAMHLHWCATPKTTPWVRIITKVHTG